LDELTQTARQAVTVVLRALAQLRKAAQDAARDRDRLGTQGRLAMRRAAVQAITSSFLPLAPTILTSALLRLYPLG
jgi:hypothetical protein